MLDLMTTIRSMSVPKLWSAMRGHKVVPVRLDFPTKRISDPLGDNADTQIEVQHIMVDGPSLCIFVTSGTLKRRVRATLSVPLYKIDLARALAGDTHPERTEE